LKGFWELAGQRSNKAEYLLRLAQTSQIKKAWGKAFVRVVCKLGRLLCSHPRNLQTSATHLDQKTFSWELANLFHFKFKLLLLSNDHLLQIIRKVIRTVLKVHIMAQFILTL